MASSPYLLEINCQVICHLPVFAIPNFPCIFRENWKRLSNFKLCDLFWSSSLRQVSSILQVVTFCNESIWPDVCRILPVPAHFVFPGHQLESSAVCRVRWMAQHRPKTVRIYLLLPFLENDWRSLCSFCARLFFLAKRRPQHSDGRSSLLVDSSLFSFLRGANSAFGAVPCYLWNWPWVSFRSRHGVCSGVVNARSRHPPPAKTWDQNITSSKNVCEQNWLRSSTVDGSDTKQIVSTLNTACLRAIPGNSW